MSKAEWKELVHEYNALATLTIEHLDNCLCVDCKRFCDLSDVILSSGLRSCPTGVCDD